MRAHAYSRLLPSASGRREDVIARPERGFGAVGRRIPFVPRVVIAHDAGEPTHVLLAQATPRERDLLSGISNERQLRQSLMARLAGHSAIERILPSAGRVNGLDILRGPNGEPLVLIDGKPGLAFLSLAHSGLIAAACVWRGDLRQIGAGVDVERIRPSDVSESSYAFSWAERRLIASQRAGEAAGLIAWSAKEAAWKSLHPKAEWGPDTVEIQKLDLNTGYALIETRGRARVHLGLKMVEVRMREVQTPDGAYILSVAHLATET
jgi:4'-phosphopantetheinyl transferase EntD